MYTVFIRNWYRKDANGKLVPNPGARRTKLREGVQTADEARRICEQYNSTHKPGKLSRKAEFTSKY